MPSVSVTKERQRQQQAMQLRDMLLTECGWPMQARQQLLGQAIKTLETQLTAKKVIVVDKSVKEVEDNQAQLRAAEAIVSMEGVNIGKSHESGSSGPVTFVFNGPLGEIFGPTTASGEGAVIEHGPANLLESKES